MARYKVIHISCDQCCGEIGKFLEITDLKDDIITNGENDFCTQECLEEFEKEAER